MTYGRVRAIVLIGLLTVVGGIVALVTLVADNQAADGASAGCKPGQPYADTEIRQEDKITVSVYNGTGRAGVADAVAADLSDRGFKAKVEKNDPNQDEVDGIGMVRFGPEGVGSAQVVRAYLFGAATREYDPDKKGAVVDLIVGKDFVELARLTDKNIALADLGQPEAPAGTCERAAG
ncbi:LytR C-terminal domain-containing protein [Micromonospora sp. CPCC 205371]|nr:LytR C-terminal domain-containing protein [Micromonospora sp. CPCC 205371]